MMSVELLRYFVQNPSLPSKKRRSTPAFASVDCLKVTEAYFTFAGMEAKLKELRCAEDEVCQIMKVAEETLEELQHLPQCDEDKLNELSAKYMELIKSVYSRISLHSSTMTKISEDDVDAIYTVKKETEIYDSLVSLSDEVKDGP